ncbi:hypothetical protein [Vibrio sp. MA40-2]|uniref:hypothetical protein n=1 Tax=Vibrio sp. MA40-2 TaxID=3391828 RepID=UPI0039A7709F
MKNSEFDIENFLNESQVEEYPDYVDQNSENQKEYFNVIVERSRTIEKLIAADNNGKLTTSIVKITGPDLARITGKKNRSSFTAKRYPHLHQLMVEENNRLYDLWMLQREKLGKNKPKESRLDLQARVRELEEEVKWMQENADKNLMKALLDIRKNERFPALRRTLEEKNKHIEQLELQNAELQLKLRNMLRPVK